MKKILVVDDNKEVRHTLEALLVKEGYYVETLTSGYDIVGYMQNKERPDAIILDLMLPGRSGLEILNSVKNKWPDTLIYIFSAHPEYRRRAAAYGANIAGFYSKVQGVEMLVQALRSIGDAP